MEGLFCFVVGLCGLGLGGFMMWRAAAMSWELRRRSRMVTTPVSQVSDDFVFTRLEGRLRLDGPPIRSLDGRDGVFYQLVVEQWQPGGTDGEFVPVAVVHRVARCVLEDDTGRISVELDPVTGIAVYSVEHFFVQTGVGMGDRAPDYLRAFAAKQGIDTGSALFTRSVKFTETFVAVDTLVDLWGSVEPSADGPMMEVETLSDGGSGMVSERESGFLAQGFGYGLVFAVIGALAWIGEAIMYGYIQV